MNNILVKELANKLEIKFSQTDLYEKWFLPIFEFLYVNLNKSWENVTAADILSSKKLSKKPGKAEMAATISLFYLNASALKDFYESQTEEDKKIIEKATWSESISYKDINEIYGRPVFQVQKSESKFGNVQSFSLFKDNVLKKWFPFITSSHDWYCRVAEKYLESCNPTLSFPLLMRNLYSDILPKPKGYYLAVSKAPDNVTLFNVEEDIFRELPLILAYYLQANIRYTQKGYPNAASARKMSKTLLLKKFPDEGESGLRALMIAGLFADDFKIDSNYSLPLALLKKLFERDFKSHPTAPYLLSHLKGINNFLPYDFRDETTHNILGIFKKMPAGWVTFKNLQLHASLHFIELNPLYYNISRLSVKDYVGEETSINRSNMEQYVSIPNLAGHIYLLAAFGLMELSIDTDAPQIYSYYDGLRACKLTDLGAYLLGLKNEYSLPEISNQTKLSFDENSPIIRIQGDIVLGDTMLANYASKVSENRYQLSPGSFLKDCKTPLDLTNKIALFKQTVAQKLPSFWENYLDQLVQNCKALTKVNHIQIYKLPTENKELQRLVAQDPVLRSIIIKAEKFNILIKESDKPLFIKRMKELGYLI